MGRLVFTMLAVAVAAAPARALADDDDGGSRGVDKGALGVGLILGEPTGICAKLYLKDDQALQFALGGAFIGGGIQAHADYVFHPYILQTRPSFVLPFYVGPGVRLIRYDNGRNDHFMALGLRAVAGLVFDFKNVPIDAFIEGAAVFEYGFKSSEGLGITFNFGGGVRYYF
jgi:hypothetical protein